MKIKQITIRLFIGTILPLLLVILSSVLRIIIDGVYHPEIFSFLLFMFIYGIGYAGIPLFIYSFIMNWWVIPKLYPSTKSIMLTSGLLGMLFPLIPMWIGGAFNEPLSKSTLTPLIMTFCIGLIVGYILKIIYPKNSINRGINNDNK